MRAYTHIKQSVPVCADQCVGIFRLPVSVSHHNKPNRAQRASSSIYRGQWSLGPQHTRICKLLSSNASLFTFDRCKVYKVCSPMYVSWSCEGDTSRNEDLMWLCLYCDGDKHTVTVTDFCSKSLPLPNEIFFFFLFPLKSLWITIKVGCQSTYA